MKKPLLLFVVLAVGSFGFVACGGSGTNGPKPPSGLTTRVVASQSVSSPAAFPGLVVIDGEIDALVTGGISTSGSPGLMALSPDLSTLLVFDSVANSVGVVNTLKQTLTGSIPLPGPTISMVALATGSGYAAVPSAPLIGSGPGAVVVMNLTTGALTATIGVPNAQTVVSNPPGTQLLVFSGDSDVVTIIYPALVNTGLPDTATVTGFDRPAYAVFSADGNTAYVLNCGAECGGTQASVQVVNLATTPPTLGALVPVNGATIGFLPAGGTTLYVVGNGTPTGPDCASIPSAPPTAAKYCGTLDLVNLTTMQDPSYNNPATEIAITDGYHDRIDMSVNGQLFVGSYNCTNIGNVNNVTGEVRGCLSIFNTTNGKVVIPPDNGDVTGLQGFTSRDVEYVAEGGNLRVYDTYIDRLLPPDIIIETGTIIIPGQIIDVKAIDFF